MSQGVRPGGCCRVPAPAPTPGGEEGRLILLLSCPVLLISTPEFPSVGSTQQQLTPPPLLAHLNSLRQRLPSSEHGAAEIFSPPASNLTTAPISTAGIHPTMAQPHQCFSCHSIRSFKPGQPQSTCGEEKSSPNTSTKRYPLQCLGFHAFLPTFSQQISED